MDDVDSAVQIHQESHQNLPIMTVEGVLDSSTYRTVRDAVIKAAIDGPLAVIVDINDLRAPSSSAWVVFTSARWHVSVWPDVPILLVCAQPQVRREISNAGVTKHVPVHSSRKLALDGVASQSVRIRRRARTSLARNISSLEIARRAITEWLTQWEIREVIPLATTLATVFVENVLDHTESAPVLMVESYGGTVAVAVEDNSSHLPGRHEDSEFGADIVSGLAIAAALSRRWGALPTSSGKTVWALIGRENQF